jgi:hypothetical protein
MSALPHCASVSTRAGALTVPDAMAVALVAFHFLAFNVEGSHGWGWGAHSRTIHLGLSARDVSRRSLADYERARRDRSAGRCGAPRR